MDTITTKTIHQYVEKFIPILFGLINGTNTGWRSSSFLQQPNNNVFLLTKNGFKLFNHFQIDTITSLIYNILFKHNSEAGDNLILDFGVDIFNSYFCNVLIAEFLVFLCSSEMSLTPEQVDELFK